MADELIDPYRAEPFRGLTEALGALTELRPGGGAQPFHAAFTTNMSQRPLAWQRGASSATSLRVSEPGSWHRRVAAGEHCGACGLPEALFGHLTRRGARYRRMDRDMSLRCAVDGGEGYLAMERPLTCVHDRDNTSAACRGIRLPKCRATPGCHAWADVVDRMRPLGVSAWMDAIYGSTSASPLRFRWSPKRRTSISSSIAVRGVEL